jgi:hypothetical protein
MVILSVDPALMSLHQNADYRSLLAQLGLDVPN